MAACGAQDKAGGLVETECGSLFPVVLLLKETPGGFPLVVVIVRFVGLSKRQGMDWVHNE